MRMPAGIAAGRQKRGKMQAVMEDHVRRFLLQNSAKTEAEQGGITACQRGTDLSNTHRTVHVVIALVQNRLALLSGHRTWEMPVIGNHGHRCAGPLLVQGQQIVLIPPTIQVMQCNVDDFHRFKRS